jgi:hypothetical protein
MDQYSSHIAGSQSGKRPRLEEGHSGEFEPAQNPYTSDPKKVRLSQELPEALEGEVQCSNILQHSSTYKTPAVLLGNRLVEIATISEVVPHPSAQQIPMLSACGSSSRISELSMHCVMRNTRPVVAYALCRESYLPCRRKC